MNRRFRILDHTDHIFDGKTAQQVKILSDGGQPRYKVGRLRDIVKADNRNIRRNAQSMLAQGSVRAKCH